MSSGVQRLAVLDIRSKRLLGVASGDSKTNHSLPVGRKDTGNNIVASIHNAFVERFQCVRNINESGLISDDAQTGQLVHGNLVDVIASSDIRLEFRSKVLTKLTRL